MSYKRGVHIFRQDLRLHDNTSFAKASQLCEELIPLFIFDTDVLDHFPHPDKRLWFQREALHLLNTQLQQHGSRLHVMHVSARNIIPKLLTDHQIDALFINKSYGRSSISRDQIVEKHCAQQWIAYIASTDYLILDPQTVPTRKVFTPFFKKRLPIVQEKFPFNPPTIASFSTPSTTIPALSDFADQFPHTHPTRKVANIRTRLQSLDLDDYATTRNIPSLTEGTTKLSPYLAFGILSPREVYTHFAQLDHEGAKVIISELARREFWNHIAINFPEARDTEFHLKRREIKRWNKTERYEARKEGRTGYPIVDAGMRQLKAENRMHNRVRMIVASFLTKDLIIDRRRWEKHFCRLSHRLWCKHQHR